MAARGEAEMFSVLTFYVCFCSNTCAQPNYTTSPFPPIYPVKGEGQVTFNEALREAKPFVKCLRAQKGRHTMPPWRIQAQKGMTAANKTFKPTSVGGGPLKEKIRFSGNVFKIEFLRAFSDGEAELRQKSNPQSSLINILLQISNKIRFCQPIRAVNVNAPNYSKIINIY